MRRLGSIVLLVIVVGSLSSACGKRDDARDVLRAALRRTERVSRELTYVEALPGKRVQQEVLAEIEDDFRYKARLRYQNKPALDEVAYDDALAVRILDQGALSVFLRKEAVPTSPADSASNPSGPTALEGLTTGRWVLDGVGAPSAVRTAKEKVVIGADPVRDALTVFAYVEDAIDRSGGVVRYNPDSVEPTYKPKEDPFPKPVKGSGTIRYDLKQVPLPPRAASSGGNQAVPSVRSFRKLAVYVNRDGYVQEIRENIDVITKLDDLAKIYGIDFPEGSATAQAQFAIDVINAVSKGQGNQEIRYRKMQLTLRKLGEENVVDLPSADVIEGDLSILRNRGRSTDQSGEDAVPTDETSTTSTSAP